ncbi:potassium channel family protein [Dongia deserti]|uniref:potassium channel family protein n=1 Tax=Dongia deserti TaxID=2268030 RepID=UPI000E64AEAE|nr:potassium channel family protein [Dongia deserti]
MQDSNRQDANGRDRTEGNWALLRELDSWLRVPMIVLSFAWLVLVVVELVWGASHLLEVFGTAIWIVFVLEFMLRLSLAPDRPAFLRAEWLTIIALIVPAVRMFAAFRALRLARAFRGLRLVRLVGTANRGMNALKRSLGRRGFGYVMLATVLVALLGAAGMLAFEPAPQVPGGFRDFGDALWWTSMILTTMGSAFWPQSGEGRLLCLLLSIYGFTVFGYITASFATLFIGHEASSSDGEVAGPAELARIEREIALLRSAVLQGSHSQGGRDPA